MIPGVLILLGIIFYSRIAGCLAVFGSVIGIIFAVVIGIDRTSIYNGGWGYN
jgi:urea transporter